jgi:hypothetical protein
MMEERLVALLEDCLVDLEAGTTLDECLKRHPAEAEELRPLLQTALALRSLRPADPPVVVRAASRAGLLAEAGRRRRRTTDDRRPTIIRRPPSAVRRLSSMTAFALAVLMLVAGVLAAGAARSLPGDPLYAFKRSVEDMQLTLARSPEAEAAYNARRIEEIQALVAARRVAEVEFWGEVALVRPSGWTVGPIYVYGDGNTQVFGSPELGDTVSVRAVIRPDGTLLAQQIVRVR